MGQSIPRTPPPPLRTSGPREVQRVVASVQTVEGGGFLVNRPFPKHGLMQVDPFLLLDEMGPTEVKPGEAVGAPDHPHRGFETVTYVLSGRTEHRDSQGNRGSLGPGDVQWMTAGDGVVHAELPAHDFQLTGGRMHGFQLWVNLPRADKRMRPRYQEKKAAELPVAETEGGAVWARVIAGEALGARAAIATRTPIAYVHFRLAPGARHAQPVDPSFNAFAYGVAGEGLYGPSRVRGRRGELVLFAPGGDAVQIENAGPEPLELLFVAGRPLGEPVVRWGPFVMNAPEEIQEAIDDFRAGRMGTIAPELG